MAWLGICAALVGCTTSAIEGPETVSHHVDPSSSVSDPASSEDPGAYDGEFSISVGEDALPIAPEEIVIQIHNGRGIQLWGSVLAGAPLRQRQMGDARISPGYGVARHRDPLGPALPERAPHPPGQLLWEGSTHARPLPLWEYV